MPPSPSSLLATPLTSPTLARSSSKRPAPADLTEPDIPFPPTKKFKTHQEPSNSLLGYNNCDSLSTPKQCKTITTPSFNNNNSNNNNNNLTNGHLGLPPPSRNTSNSSIGSTKSAKNGFGGGRTFSSNAGGFLFSSTGFGNFGFDFQTGGDQFQSGGGADHGYEIGDGFGNGIGGGGIGGADLNWEDLVNAFVSGGGGALGGGDNSNLNLDLNEGSLSSALGPPPDQIDFNTLLRETPFKTASGFTPALPRFLTSENNGRPENENGNNNDSNNLSTAFPSSGFSYSEHNDSEQRRFKPEEFANFDFEGITPLQKRKSSLLALGVQRPEQQGYYPHYHNPTIPFSSASGTAASASATAGPVGTSLAVEALDLDLDYSPSKKYFGGNNNNNTSGSYSSFDFGGIIEPGKIFGGLTTPGGTKAGGIIGNETRNGTGAGKDGHAVEVNKQKGGVGRKGGAGGIGIGRPRLSTPTTRSLARAAAARNGSISRNFSSSPNEGMTTTTTGMMPGSMSIPESLHPPFQLSQESGTTETDTILTSTVGGSEGEDVSIPEPALEALARSYLEQRQQQQQEQNVFNEDSDYQHHYIQPGSPTLLPTTTTTRDNGPRITSMPFGFGTILNRDDDNGVINDSTNSNHNDQLFHHQNEIMNSPSPLSLGTPTTHIRTYQLESHPQIQAESQPHSHSQSHSSSSTSPPISETPYRDRYKCSTGVDVWLNTKHNKEVADFLNHHHLGGGNGNGNGGMMDQSHPQQVNQHRRSSRLLPRIGHPGFSTANTNNNNTTNSQPHLPPPQPNLLQAVKSLSDLSDIQLDPADAQHFLEQQGGGGIDRYHGNENVNDNDPKARAGSTVVHPHTFGNFKSCTATGELLKKRAGKKLSGEEGFESNEGTPARCIGDGSRRPTSVESGSKVEVVNQGQVVRDKNKVSDSLIDPDLLPLPPSRHHPYSSSVEPEIEQDQIKEILEQATIQTVIGDHGEGGHGKGSKRPPPGELQLPKPPTFNFPDGSGSRLGYGKPPARRKRGISEVSTLTSLSDLSGIEVEKEKGIDGMNDQGDDVFLDPDGPLHAPLPPPERSRVHRSQQNGDRIASSSTQTLRPPSPHHRKPSTSTGTSRQTEKQRISRAPAQTSTPGGGQTRILSENLVASPIPHQRETITNLANRLKAAASHRMINQLASTYLERLEKVVLKAEEVVKHGEGYQLKQKKRAEEKGKGKERERVVSGISGKNVSGETGTGIGGIPQTSAMQVDDQGPEIDELADDNGDGNDDVVEILPHRGNTQQDPRVSISSAMDLLSRITNRTNNGNSASRTTTADRGNPSTSRVLNPTPNKTGNTNMSSNSNSSSLVNRLTRTGSGSGAGARAPSAPSKRRSTSGVRSSMGGGGTNIFQNDQTRPPQKSHPSPHRNNLSGSYQDPNPHSNPQRDSTQSQPRSTEQYPHRSSVIELDSVPFTFNMEIAPQAMPNTTSPPAAAPPQQNSNPLPTTATASKDLSQEPNSISAVQSRRQRRVAGSFAPRKPSGSEPQLAPPPTVHPNPAAATTKERSSISYVGLLPPNDRSSSSRNVGVQHSTAQSSSSSSRVSSISPLPIQSQSHPQHHSQVVPSLQLSTIELRQRYHPAERRTRSTSGGTRKQYDFPTGPASSSNPVTRPRPKRSRGSTSTAESPASPVDLGDGEGPKRKRMTKRAGNAQLRTGKFSGR